MRFLPDSFGSFSFQVRCSQAVPAVSALRNRDVEKDLRNLKKDWERSIIQDLRKIWERESVDLWDRLSWFSPLNSTSLNKSHRGSKVSHSAWAVVNHSMSQHITALFVKASGPLLRQVPSTCSCSGTPDIAFCKPECSKSERSSIGSDRLDRHIAILWKELTKPDKHDKTRDSEGWGTMEARPLTWLLLPWIARPETPSLPTDSGHALHSQVVQWSL